MIGLHDLELLCSLGVTAEERASAQTVRVDITLERSIAEAAASDQLSHTLDYQALASTLQASIEGLEFNLIERLATHLLETIQSHFSAVRITLKVKKPSIPFAAYAFCEVSA